MKVLEIGPGTADGKSIHFPEADTADPPWPDTDAAGSRPAGNLPVDGQSTPSGVSADDHLGRPLAGRHAGTGQSIRSARQPRSA